MLGVFMGIIIAKIAVSIMRILHKRQAANRILQDQQTFKARNKSFEITEYSAITEPGEKGDKELIKQQLEGETAEITDLEVLPVNNVEHESMRNEKVRHVRKRHTRHVVV
jgi:hypothetical protein